MKIVPAGANRPARPVAPARAIRKAGDVITACGCVCIPEPVIHMLGERKKSVWCDRHGWQAIRRPATLAERAGLGTVLPFPDEPPF